MASTAQQRLFEIYTAYKSALDRRPADLKEASKDADVDKILDNVDALQAAYFEAARVALDATGDAIEDAYRAAKDANKKVGEAYKNGKALADRIRLVSSLVSRVGNLIEKASQSAAAEKTGKQVAAKARWARLPPSVVCDGVPKHPFPPAVPRR